MNATIKSKRLLKRFSMNLERGTISNCAEWACKRRVMGKPFKGPWSFERFPWLYEPHISEHQHQVAYKGAQLGFTEWALNKSFYKIDHHRLTVLYCLPTRGNASDFSAARFDPALEESDYIKSMFTGTKNVGLKIAGTAALYLRGSKSRADLKSIPAAVLIFDEIDEMPEESVSLGEHRKDGQDADSDDVTILKLSTGTIPDFGIDLEYQNSDQRLYFFKCPACSRSIDLQYPRNLEVCGDSLDDPNLHKSRIFCHKCDATLDHRDKMTFLKLKEFGGTGGYVAQKNFPDKEGYSVNQLYSTAIAGTPIEWAKAVILARTNKTREQELYNSKAGKAHVVSGAKLTRPQIDACRSGYTKTVKVLRDRPRTMGIDVGSVFHISIDEWDEIVNIGKPNQRYRPKLLLETTSKGGAWDLTEIIHLFNEYKVHACVIDAEPERRVAMQLLHSLGSYAWMCDYSEGLRGGDVKIDDSTGLIQINRTNWMDIATGRILHKNCELPYDVSDEFCDHFENVVRVYKENRDKHEIGRYINTGPDHFVHSRVYSEVALPFALHQGSEDIYDLF